MTISVACYYISYHRNMTMILHIIDSSRASWWPVFILWYINSLTIEQYVFVIFVFDILFYNHLLDSFRCFTIFVVVFHIYEYILLLGAINSFITAPACVLLLSTYQWLSCLFYRKRYCFGGYHCCRIVLPGVFTNVFCFDFIWIII